MSMPAEKYILKRLEENSRFNSVISKDSKPFASKFQKKLREIFVYLILRFYSVIDVIFLRGVVFPIMILFNAFLRPGVDGVKNDKGQRAIMEINYKGEQVPAYYPFSQWVEIKLCETVMDWFFVLLEETHERKKESYIDKAIDFLRLPRWANRYERVCFFHSTFRWFIAGFVLSACIGAYYEYNSRSPLNRLSPEELHQEVFNYCIQQDDKLGPVARTYTYYLEYRKNHAHELRTKQISSMASACEAGTKIDREIREKVISQFCNISDLGNELSEEKALKAVRKLANKSINFVAEVPDISETEVIFWKTEYFAKDVPSRLVKQELVLDEVSIEVISKRFRNEFNLHISPNFKMYGKNSPLYQAYCGGRK